MMASLMPLGELLWLMFTRYTRMIGFCNSHHLIEDNPTTVFLKLFSQVCIGRMATVHGDEDFEVKTDMQSKYTEFQACLSIFTHASHLHLRLHSYSPTTGANRVATAAHHA